MSVLEPERIELHRKDVAEAHRVEPERIVFRKIWADELGRIRTTFDVVQRPYKADKANFEALWNPKPSK